MARGCEILFIRRNAQKTKVRILSYADDKSAKEKQIISCLPKAENITHIAVYHLK
jgi:hypothetical protein